MKRFIFACLLAVILLPAFAGCGNRYSTDVIECNAAPGYYVNCTYSDDPVLINDDDPAYYLAQNEPLYNNPVGDSAIIPIFYNPVQSLFEPIKVRVNGAQRWSDCVLPEYYMFYPFGEIFEQEGFASYVVFLEDGIYVEISENFLRAVAPQSGATLEITQFPNASLDDVKNIFFAEWYGLRFNMPPQFRRWNNFYTAKLERLRPDGETIDSRLGGSVAIKDNLNGGVIAVTGTGWEPKFFHSHTTLLLFDPTDPPPPDENVQYIFVFVESWLDLTRLYAWDMTIEGMADYRIYVLGLFDVEQHDNLLRIQPSMRWGYDRIVDITRFDLGQNDNLLKIQPEMTWFYYGFMEIIQVPDITVDEMIYKIKNDPVLERYDSMFYREPSTFFPFVTVFFQTDKNKHRWDLDWDDPERQAWEMDFTTAFHVKDNLLGGVFVIKTVVHTPMTCGMLNCTYFRAFMWTMVLLS